MQASINSSETFDIDKLTNNAPSRLVDKELAAPDESYNAYIPPPFVLEPQQEDNISIDMIQLYQELLPSKESHDRRVKFVQLMERLMNNEWPDHDIKAHVFGSSVNDLGTSSSDVDLCITTPWGGLRNVRTLAKLFRKCGMQHVVCVPRAKVPIVRLFDPELQLSCDINVNNTLALQNTKMIKTYVALDPRVRPLLMIIKHWTKQRQLNDAANGGTLSSYTWTCMIINFLQQRQPPILPVLHAIDSEGKDEAYFFDDVDKLKGFGDENQESIGGLLFAFFRRFAVEFDYDDQVVSVRQGRYLTKAEKGWDTGRNKMSLCVEEPFNVGRNLGNSADIASVHGLRCEFQRFLELLIAGETLETICTPYQPITFSSTSTTNTADIPSNNNINHGSNNNTLTLTLPAENRTSSFFLPIYAHSSSSSYNSPTTTTAHPYDRRRSMVDGICSYPTPSILLDSHTNAPHPTHPTSYTYRAPPISRPYNSSYDTFHPRFSSPQALDTILRVRNTRHGSHPLPPVPSTLLSMLNINANHGTDQSVERIFARYNRKPQPHYPQQQQQPQQQIPSQQQPPQQQQKSTEARNHNAKKNMGVNRRKGGNSNGNNGNNNNNNHRHYHENGVSNNSSNNKRAPQRRSSGMDWPTISTSTSTPSHAAAPVATTTTTTHSENNMKPSFSTEQPQRSRRWSTTKKQQQQQQQQNEEPRKKTLAEIVKIASPLPPPTLKQKSSPSSPIPSASSSSKSNNNRNRRPQRNNNNRSSSSSSTTSSNNNNKPKKKKSSRAA